MADTPLSLDMEIEIRVPPERVWRAWTEGDEFVAWWGEDGRYRVTSWTGDVRVGGRWRSEGVIANGKPFAVEGRYLHVDPPQALSFTWRHDWDEEVEETVVSLEFHPTPEGTLLRLQHSGFTTDKVCLDHRQGWTLVLGWLRTHLTSNGEK